VASGGVLLAGAGAVELVGVSVETLSTVSDIASFGAALSDAPGCASRRTPANDRLVACVGAFTATAGAAVGEVGKAMSLLPAAGDAMRGVAMVNAEAGASSLIFHWATLARAGR